MANDEQLKEAAAREAVREVESGMVLGLGTGSTAKWAVIAIGEKLASGELRDVVGVPTSEHTRALAIERGVPLAPLEAHASIDLAIDGADEVDPRLDLIKGLGGALLREKQVELRAKRFIVVADASKLVSKLGTKAPVPVEVPRDRWRDFVEPLRALGSTPVLRVDAAGQPKITDGGHAILDCRF
ncbi:ribose 5-phosphate isomerase A, partial [Myxococcota bacterium]|nr:ribose 5-phosphate isomerase A [Myxococcota bacterium]